MRVTYIYRFSKNLEINLTYPQQLLKNRLDKLNIELTTEPEEKGLFGFFKKHQESKVRGVYIYGGVGQGKTMLMDLFYDNVKVSKYRIHFHEFMIDIQKKLHKNKQQHSYTDHNSNNKDNALDLVCREFVKNYKLLCLDEFHVTHISDAMILKELFTNLFNRGLTLVCTSNRAPEELYKNGLNRDRFLPFIPILHKYCDIFNLNSQDFRQKIVSGSSKLDKKLLFLAKDLDYFLEQYSVENKVNRKEIVGKILQVTPLRSVKIPYCHGKVSFFNFSDFSSTQSSVGTDSFIQIANNFHTIYLANIPEFDTNIQYNNQLRTFIQLIDILYEKNIKLVLSTNKPLIHIFGMYGVIKLFDDFCNKFNINEVKLPEEMNKDEFLNLLGKFTSSSSDSIKLFDSMLKPNESTLKTKRLYKIIDTHRKLMNGESPQDFTLYKLDTNDENINEDEFQCSRTLSRLFHMSTSDYLEKHRELYE